MDYALQAKKEKSSVLGMSDHTPLPDGRWPHMRMALSELEEYIAEIEEAAEALPELKILKGVECEWAPEYISFYQEELIGKHSFDYLIGAVHWFPHHGEWLYIGDADTPQRLVSYARHMAKTIESGLFTFIAHPDGFGLGYNQWDENARACSLDIIASAEACALPLEINGYGLRKKKVTSPAGALRRPYPLDEFWQLASGTKIQAVCNSDAHKPSDLFSSVDQARALAEEFSVPVIDPFER